MKILGILPWILIYGSKVYAQGEMTTGITFSAEYEDFGFKRDFSVPVMKITGLPFTEPWIGGLNACQFSETDLNLDGTMDLVIFDRHGNRILPFINQGHSSQVDYTYAPEYRAPFPDVREWMNLVDFNYDGKNDLFTYTTGGIRVYKNVSDTSLAFVLEEPLLYSYYYSGYVNLFVLPDDYPAFTDVDMDGDMDILNFFTLGKYLNYHKNLSVEKYGVPDSLDFRLTELCWGNFEENELSNVLSLGINCEGRTISDALDRHAGSTLLAMDMDGDQDKDLLVGDIDYANIIGLTNGGTPEEAFMTGQDTTFPSGSTPVDLMSMPVCTYMDVDNDDVRDLLVSPFDPGLDRTENQKSTWFYKNLGMNDAPVFQLKQTDFIQEWMIDLGAGAYPVIIDVNQDGLEDLVVGNFGYLDSSYYSLGYLYLIYRSQVALFLNTGTEGTPAFRLTDPDFGNISSLMIQGASPALADLDNDGDIDMLTGSSDGTLIFLDNLAGPGNMPVFASPVMHYKDIDVGEYSSPQLIDLDRDGMTDLVTGKRDGTLSYYRNTGTGEAPEFTLMSDHLGDVDVTDTSLSLDGFSTPCFFEVDGEYRLFAGSEFGQLFYYKNIDGNLDGAFTLVDDHYLYIDEGSRTCVAVWNFNNDAFPDLIIGNYSGGLSLFKGITPPELGMDELPEVLPGIRVYPNPVREVLFMEMSESILKDKCDVRITDLLGRQVYAVQTFSDETFTLEVSHLPNGVYLVTVRNKKGFSVTCKFLKY